MKRLVGDGVHGLLGSPAFQHRPGEHDLPGSSAVVAQPVLVERLDHDLCPVRHPQHGKLIGGQLLCQFGLAVQRRRFPGILRKAGQEFLFVKLCRRFCLRLQGCRCGQIHPAAPYAPARRTGGSSPGRGPPRTGCQNRCTRSGGFSGGTAGCCKGRHSHFCNDSKCL